jgi:uncharacterized membrane protein
MLPLRDELYHPLIVHLPIAISIIWVLFESTLLLLRKKRREMDLSFVLLSSFGAISAFLANLTGELAESIHHTAASAEVMKLIEYHSDLAVYIVWFYVVLLVVASVIMVANFEWLRILRFGIACGLLIVVAIAAHRGAMLVFEKGVAVDHNLLITKEKK